MVSKVYQSLVADLEKVTCEVEIEHVFTEFCKVSDLEYFIFAIISSVNSLSSPQVFTLSNYPENWFGQYFDEEMQKHDPVVKYCFENSAPIRWDKLVQLEKYVDPEGEQIMQRASEVGLVNGVSIPINSRNGELAIFSLATARMERIDERLQDALFHAQPFGAQAVDSFKRVKEKLTEKELGKLTPRELECLFWACEGKTTWEISKILEVSERTIIFHLSSATQKMGAVNRQHAVAKAIISGLIRPTP